MSFGEDALAVFHAVTAAGVSVHAVIHVKFVVALYALACPMAFTEPVAALSLAVAAASSNFLAPSVAAVRPSPGTELFGSGRLAAAAPVTCAAPVA